jgi:hypothetical protein
MENSFSPTGYPNGRGIKDMTQTPVPKVHPATREILPDDPMQMTGFEVPGDPDLMLRLLVEEYARIGWDFNAIMQLACDPNYQAFHGLLKSFGEQKLRTRVAQIISRCGVMRVTQTETEIEATPAQLVQIALPQPVAPRLDGR